MQAVILAGGFGTRLSHVVSDVPKPMAPISGKPFLEYQINLLTENGFDNFVLLTGYKANVIEDYFKNDARVKCVEETTPLGTGGALLNAYDWLEDEFTVINGDTLFDIDFSILHEFAKDKDVTIALRYSTDISRYGLIEINDTYNVLEFKEKCSFLSDYIDGYINGGIYHFHKSALKELQGKFYKQNISMETEIFPYLLKKGLLYGLPIGGGFIDIGIPEDYNRAQTYILDIINAKRIPALFIDKDGTIIENTSYPHGKDILIIEDTLDIVKKYYDKGFLVIMCTNQAGLAKSKFSIEEMDENICAIRQFYEKHNIKFTDIQYCPYHIDGTKDEYKYLSLARKPDPGMILRACEKFRIDLKNSVMIGDNPLVDRIKLPCLKSFILGEDNV